MVYHQQTLRHLFARLCYNAELHKKFFFTLKKPFYENKILFQGN